MAKKKTLESFNNGCKFELYLNITNYSIGDLNNSIYSNVLKNMKDITNKGYRFYKNYQEIHQARQKPGFFSKFFNTRYNRLYNLEKENLDLMRSDLYKLGVPHNILLENHKMNDINDTKEINYGVEDCFFGVRNENNSLRANRWRDGLNIEITTNNETISVSPKPISSYVINKEPKENMDLSDEFEVINHTDLVDDLNKDEIIKENYIENIK